MSQKTKAATAPALKAQLADGGRDALHELTKDLAAVESVQRRQWRRRHRRSSNRTAPLPDKAFQSLQYRLMDLQKRCAPEHEAVSEDTLLLNFVCEAYFEDVPLPYLLHFITYHIPDRPGLRVWDAIQKTVQLYQHLNA